MKLWWEVLNSIKNSPLLYIPGNENTGFYIENPKIFYIETIIDGKNIPRVDLRYLQTPWE